MGSRFLLGCAGLAFIVASPGLAGAAGVTFSDAGVISDGVLDFQTALGNPNNGNVAGPLASGRREINWDGASALTPANPVLNFRNNRGATFATPGGTGGVFGTVAEVATLFGNATYNTTLGVFSSPRLFTPVGTNITDVLFFLPGTNGGVQATVTGFGAVFTDVDLADSTRLEFYDFSNNLLLSQLVAPSAGDAGLSFLGVIFNAGEKIARVRIVGGNSALGPTDNPGGGIDIVAIDDLLFAEPQRVPGPAGLAVLGLAGIGLLLRRALTRRGRRPQPA